MSQAIVPQNILMISESVLKSFTDIDPNVTSSVLLPFVTLSQQLTLEYIIGRPYYVQLLQQIQDNTITGDTTNYNFLNYFCKPLLIWDSYKLALPSIWMRIRNNGVLNGTENSVSVTEMEWQQARADSTSQFFQERMRQEIIFNSQFYPLCFNFTSSQGLFPHLTKNYNMNIHLPNGHGDNGALINGMLRSGIGYYAGPEFACVSGGLY